jgi:hypothetical protein
MTGPRALETGLAVALAAFAGPLLRTPSFPALAGLVAGGLAAWGLCRISPRVGVIALIAGVSLTLLLALASPSAAVGPLARWFSPSDGLVYWNPVVWLGLAGAIAPAARASAGAGLVAAVAFALMPAGSAMGAALAAAVPALLVPAMAAALAAAQRSASTRPLVWLGAAGVALAAWNFLFMEQYRRNLIPRDDTVSFADVAGTNRTLFQRAFGDPGTWPACWLFALRHGVSPDRYGPVAERSWMLEAGDTEVVDLRGAPEPIFVTLREPKALEIGLEAAGTGTLDIVVNGARAATVPLSPQGGEVRVQAAHSFWRRGPNEVRLVPSAGDALPARLTLRRVGGAV